MEDKKMKATKMDLKNILGELTGITDGLLDDGRDYEDERQNASFGIERWKVERIGERLSTIDVEGVDEETLDAEWRKAWGNCNNKNLPECQYNHHVNYINALIALIGGNDNG